MLSLLINTASPTQNGLLDNFLSPGSGIEQDFVRGDVSLALSLRNVVPSVTSTRPWDDDWLNTDTFQVGIGNRSTAPTAGTWKLGVQRSTTKTISTNSVANPTVVTTTGAHGYATGDIVLISGNITSSPSINGAYYVVTVLSSTTFSIPVNVTVGGTGGTVTSFNTSTLTALGFAVTAAALTTALSAISVAEGYSALTVTLPSEGNYQVAWSIAGAVPALYSDGSLLLPASGVSVVQTNAGSGTAAAAQLLILNQSVVAYAMPSTPFTAAAIAATTAQAGDATHNKIVALTMTSGTYGGTFSCTLTTIAAVVTSFTASGTTSSDDFSTLLNTASGITSGDITVERVGDVLNVTFGGTQQHSNTPTLTAANVDLLAPLGVTGTIALNTYNLYIAFAQTTSDELTFDFSIRRTRASGEQAEYFIHDVTLKRNLLDPTTMIPTPTASYYTAAQSDAKYALLGANIDITSLKGTTTNDSAAAGKIGEFTSSLVAVGSAVSLTTATGANVTTLSLTAGDWDVEGNVNFSGTTATETAAIAGISSTSATVPTDGSEAYSGILTTTATEKDSITLPMKRFSLAVTTMIYLVAKVTFSAGTVVGFGAITARRAR